MSVKLVDYRHEVEEDVEFGTCELCMGTGDLHYGVFVFQDDEGNRTEVENGGWDWGDYMEDYFIASIPRFAGFFNEQKVESLDGIDQTLNEVYVKYEGMLEEEFEGDD